MEKTYLEKKQRGFKSFYTHGEEIFNAVSHIVGGGIGLALWILLAIYAYPSVSKILAVSIFGLSVVLLYTMSALYHFLPDGRAKAVFRIFDHCTIFLLIAGSYTPFCVIALKDTIIGLVILIAEWVLAVLGITGNAIAMKNKVIKGLSMSFYVVMGWAALLFLPLLFNRIPTAAIWLLLCGGISYTAGILFFALGKKVRYFHSVWHLFDICGTVLQGISILMIL